MQINPLYREPSSVIPIEEKKIGNDYADVVSANRAFSKVYSLGMKEREKLKRTDLVEIEECSKKIEDTVDDIIYWDENNNLLYVEAIAIFNDTSEFVRFRNNLPTLLGVTEFCCPVCSSKKWIPRSVDAKVVTDEEGKKWKCFSIIFACKSCLSKGRTTERRMKLLGFKYALIKFGRGLKDFLDCVETVKIDGDLTSEKGSAEIKMGQKKITLQHCPLL